MSKPFNVKVVLGDAEYVCSCTYSPETPDTMYRSNGDPGDPGDPEEFELLAVTLEFAPKVSAVFVSVAGFGVKYVPDVQK